jgi:hypothetical protein
MRQFNISELTTALTSLTAICRDLSTADQISKPSCTDEMIVELDLGLEMLFACCFGISADSFLISQIVELRNEIKRKQVDRREAVLCVRLTAILKGVENNLQSRRFMHVPADQAPYWNSFFWFGNDFLSVFGHLPKVELVELGNCITAGRWTACVFHSMRLAE